MSVAIFAALKWELGIVEAIIVIMSVGLSVDFVVHFGVGYIHTDSHNIEQERKKIHDSYQSDTLINGSAKEKNSKFRQLSCQVEIFLIFFCLRFQIFILIEFCMKNIRLNVKCVSSNRSLVLDQLCSWLRLQLLLLDSR